MASFWQHDPDVDDDVDDQMDDQNDVNPDEDLNGPPWTSWDKSYPLDSIVRDPRYLKLCNACSTIGDPDASGRAAHLCLLAASNGVPLKGKKAVKWLKLVGKITQAMAKALEAITSEMDDHGDNDAPM